MCLILFAWQHASSTGLILAANRDEFHGRPTAAADFWSDTPSVLAGRDLQAGGTWLGITRRGRFAAITNVRDPDSAVQVRPRSRGELTHGFLAGTATPQEYLREVSHRVDAYAGFNLLVSDGDTLWYLHGGGLEDQSPRALTPGIYGLSNAALNVAWPKVELGRTRFAAALETAKERPIEHAELAACLSGRSMATQDSLARHGLKGEMAEQLSAQFIVTPGYGTRCTTTLHMAGQAPTRFREQRFDANGDVSGCSEFTL